MKWILLSLILVLQLACSSLPHERQTVRSLLNQKGYFTRPVKLATNSPSTAQEFSRCEISQIDDIRWQNSDDKLDYFTVKVSQAGKSFFIEEINQQKISSFQTEESTIHSLKNFFSPELMLQSRKVKDPSLKKTVDAKDLVCNDIIFTGMSAKELLFVKGRPLQLRIPSSERDGLEEWIYKSDDEKKYIRFQLVNAKIQRWKESNKK